MKKNSDSLVILDCTIRDGNYSVNFKFTEEDTKLLTQEIVRLGFEWVEVGHGLGMGAADAGKGKMPSSEVSLIKAAKSVAGKAKIGVFLIPGIASLEHLKIARDAGVDFIRIGDNAPNAERAFPFIREARKLGMLPCLNMMKSYAISPDAFAEKSMGAAEEGAEVVYLVDSAGSMMPDDVIRYFSAVRSKTDCLMGFHGHNNLMMVIANCLAAYKHGARFLDATLCGLGRSAGNAPTEMLIAVLEKMGIPTGINLFDVMDTIDDYMWPMVSQTRPHDMLGVTAGFTQFHSSFLQKVNEAALKYQVDLRRLIAKVAEHDPVEIDDKFLEKTAKEMRGTQRTTSSEKLLSFYVPDLSPDRISNSYDSVRALIDGMAVSAAKRPGAKMVLQLVPNYEMQEDFVLADFVMEDHDMVMGRLVYGDKETLDKAVEMTKTNAFLYLVNQDDGWAEEAPLWVAQIAGKERTIPFADTHVREQFMMDVMSFALQKYGQQSLLAYCPDDILRRVVSHQAAFRKVFVFDGDRTPNNKQKNVVTFANLEDWRSLNLQFDLVICSSAPDEKDARVLSRALSPKGKIVVLSQIVNAAVREILNYKLVTVDLNLAYAGLVSRYLTIDGVFRPVMEEV